jgi:hypothetical protein
MLGGDDYMKYINERKKSGSSNNSKGKDREKSEGSLLFLNEEGKNDKVTHFFMHKIFNFTHLISFVI